MGAQRVRRQGRFHLVDALAHRLDDGVAGILDDIGVVAHPADHEVRPCAADQLVDAIQAIKHVVARATHQRVAEFVAGAAEPAAAGEPQVLDMGVQRVRRQGRSHPVDALARRLDDDIAGILDEIGVVARPADHEVRPCAADQLVVAIQAIKQVVAFASVQHVGAGAAGQRYSRADIALDVDNRGA